MKTEEEIAELIALSPAQLKAFRRLQRAVKDCKKLNVFFYQNMEHLGALNGNNVERVVGSDETDFETYGPRFTGDHNIPSVNTTGMFADDCHHIILHDD